MNPVFIRCRILQQSRIWDRLERKAAVRTWDKDGLAILSLSSDRSDLQKEQLQFLLFLLLRCSVTSGRP